MHLILETILMKRLIPIILCVVVAGLQLQLLRRLSTWSRTSATASKQELLFDIGAFIFLTAIQALLLRSFLQLTSGSTWIAVLIMAGIAIVVIAISFNVATLVQRK